MRSAGRTRPRRAAVAVSLLALLSLLPLTATAQDLEDVREDRAQLEDELAAKQRQLEEVEAQVYAKEDELAELDERKTQLEAEMSQMRDALEVRARAIFKRGGDLNTLEALVSADGPTEGIQRASTLDALARRDGASIESTQSLRIQLEQTEKLRARTLEDLQALRTQIESIAADLTDELHTVKILQRDLELRAKRQRMIDRGTQQGIYSCPIAHPYSFIDSWGFPRSGGRRHKGVDIMSPYGNDVYAFTSGTISRMKSGGLGGIVLYLNGDDGNRYYYAHLAGYAPGIYGGKRVVSGELIAYNGDSGNARGGAPHIHFEVHPGGGSAINPYPWVAAACF